MSGRGYVFEYSTDTFHVFVTPVSYAQPGSCSALASESCGVKHNIIASLLDKVV